MQIVAAKIFCHNQQHWRQYLAYPCGGKPPVAFL